VTKEQQLPAAKIGNNCIIGTQAVIYRGAVIGTKVLIADLSTVRENVTIGDFTIVGRGVAIENFCTIGRYCKLETNVYITAYSEIGDRVFVAPCVATSNDNFVGRTEERFKHFKGVTVKRGARIGVHATILPGKTIAADTLVAAGALVTRDTKAKRSSPACLPKNSAMYPQTSCSTTRVGRNKKSAVIYNVAPAGCRRRELCFKKGSQTTSVPVTRSGRCRSLCWI
jgi:UDP-3-O-[3-hydroxymyristoyl] glucosamine N-acyltransferase